VTELLLIESLSRQVLLSFLNPLFLLVLVFCSTMVEEMPVPDPPLPLNPPSPPLLQIAAPSSSHPEPRTTLETTPSHPELHGIKSVEVVDPGIELLEVVALLPASNPSPRHAAGGNITLKASSIEVPRLSESVEAAPHDHLALAVILCPNDQQRTSPSCL
jgi:hypothetical protein